MPACGSTRWKYSHYLGIGIGKILRELTLDPTKDYHPEKLGKRKHPGPKTGV